MNLSEYGYIADLIGIKMKLITNTYLPSWNLKWVQYFYASVYYCKYLIDIRRTIELLYKTARSH